VEEAVRREFRIKNLKNTFHFSEKHYVNLPLVEEDRNEMKRREEKNNLGD